MIVDFLDFTIGAGIGDGLRPDVAQALRGHRIVLERWIHPLMDGSGSEEQARDAASWIADAASDLVQGRCTAHDLRAEGFKFRLYSPTGVFVFDTITRAQ